MWHIFPPVLETYFKSSFWYRPSLQVFWIVLPPPPYLNTTPSNFLNTSSLLISWTFNPSHICPRKIWLSMYPEVENMKIIKIIFVEIRKRLTRSDANEGKKREEIMMAEAMRIRETNMTLKLCEI